MDVITNDAGLIYEDTVALLQEEISRLEAELRLRDAAVSAPPAPPAPDTVALSRVAELTATLAERDAAIEVLWEEVARLEAARAGEQDEWDQLFRCIDAMERRLEESGPAGSGVELGEARRRVGELEEQLASERATSVSRQARLEAELKALSCRLEEAASAAASADDRCRVALEQGRGLAGAEAALEVADLGRRLEEAEREAQTLRDRFAGACESLERMRLDHAAELITLRGERPAARIDPSAAGATPDERIRALREHLKEIHAQEDTDRRDRQVSARLSRLWARLNSPL